jgi:catechol 2,3-dioxygenase-like lactoylglutathione lyase family enzyme
MILHIDHVTVVVRDVAKATAFFALLGFDEEKSVVISGAQFASYMGVEGIEAEHVTLVSTQASPRFEIQLLRYIRPQHLPDAHVEKTWQQPYLFCSAGLESGSDTVIEPRHHTTKRHYGLPRAEAGLSLRS